jgi:2-amino-4-hydroxy-6-hydroxymethyldihydropteridine diphosphokinase
MNKAYLLIGGNLGDRVDYLRKASFLIEQEAGKMIAHSSIYETAAWGMENQGPFLNQVILIETDVSAKNLLNKVLAIEEKLGRKRMEKYGPRTIDIDILLFNAEFIDEANLKVPHRSLHERRFALTPLSEIAPDIIHPRMNKTVKQLLEECTDGLPVEKFQANT